MLLPSRVFLWHNGTPTCVVVVYNTDRCPVQLQLHATSSSQPPSTRQTLSRCFSKHFLPPSIAPPEADVPPPYRAGHSYNAPSFVHTHTSTHTTVCTHLARHDHHGTKPHHKNRRRFGSPLHVACGKCNSSCQLVSLHQASAPLLLASTIVELHPAANTNNNC
jgi:hypothetical protein